MNMEMRILLSILTVCASLLFLVEKYHHTKDEKSHGILLTEKDVAKPVIFKTDNAPPLNIQKMINFNAPYPMQILAVDHRAVMKIMVPSGDIVICADSGDITINGRTGHVTWNGNQPDAQSRAFWDAVETAKKLINSTNK